MLPIDPTVSLGAPVPQGPRAYRSRIRALGPLAGLLPAAVLGGLALLLLRGDGSAITGAGGFALSVLAAPLMLVAGVPLTTSTTARTAAVVASAVMWLLLGLVAARRSTRRPVASWGDFWKEFAWLAAGVWLGVLGSLVAVDLLLGRPLF